MRGSAFVVVCMAAMAVPCVQLQLLQRLYNIRMSLELGQILLGAMVKLEGLGLLRTACTVFKTDNASNDDACA
jgi:hypothetical protein